MDNNTLVNIGIQRFDRLIEENKFYIDKTEFIREWWEEGSDVTVITRPRRFGKTLNMSMVECFFSTKYANRGDLFEKLSIWKKEIYRQMQGTFPMIFLSFANIKAAAYQKMEYRITKVIADLYAQNTYLLDGNLLTDNEKEYYNGIKPGMNDEVAVDAIHTMAAFMKRYYNRDVIIILDEYDTPMQEAWLHGYWEEAAIFFSSFMNSTFKTNPYLRKGLITGITRIAKDSIFSGMNNPDIVTTTSDKYATAFGFTEEEVFAALDNMGLEMEKVKVKKWYNGFTFGRHTNIYNPWSIASFIDKGGKYDFYWADTSSNDLVNSLVQQGSSDIKEAVEDLLQGKNIVAEIDEKIVFNQLESSANAVWSLLLATGYLKVLKYESVGEREKKVYTLSLTNFENKDKIAFQPEELLFYAIYAKDIVIVEELRKLGVKLSEMRIHAIVDGGRFVDKYRSEYIVMTEKLSNEDYLEVMEQLALELDGKPFYLTEKIFNTVKERLCDAKIFEFFLTHFNQKNMKKYQIIRGLIDKDAVEILSIIEKEGWLTVPKKRDEMIEYASEKGRTESLAWLLDFKNRTADFDAEQKLAEKKLMRELNASPDSIFAFKQIWSYRKREDGTLIITNYKGKDVEVTVPEKIGKGTVTAIGKGAFSGSINNTRVNFNSRATVEQAKHHGIITKITLPKTLQYIDKGAFCEMVALEEINIPEGVEEIGESAFRECSSLKNINIPEDVEEIGVSTFSKCSSLKNITIPKKMKKIGGWAFNECSSLQNITIPEGVEVIGEGAFYKCSSLKDVTISEGVKEIGRNAFSGCSSLRNITIPKGVRKIGNSAFWKCSSLKSVTIPEEVKKIGNWAFSECHSLRNITISKGVEEIGEGAFEFCRSLQGFTIPEGIREIGRDTFWGCSSLKSITIPERVKEIGNSAFRECASLKNITILEGVKEIGGSAFRECASLKNITIPKGVDKIGDEAFVYCKNLEKVYICEGVLKIDELAFACCSNLTEIRIPKSVQHLMTDVSRCHKWHEVFSNCPNLTIYCPKGSKTETYCKKKGFPFKNIED